MEKIKPDKIKARKVNYNVRYTGPSDFSLKHGKTYRCIGEITDDFQKGFLFIIDESGEDYIYAPDYFQKTEN